MEKEKWIEIKNAITIVEKTYISAYLITGIVAIIYYFFNKNEYMIFFIVFSLLSFTFAFFNDIVENGKMWLNGKNWLLKS